MNSTYNIGIPQQRRIQEELVRAAFLTQDEFNWRALYNRNDFFGRHANFLQISVRAGENPEEFTKWLRLCESRLRLLVGALDCPQMSVWPFAQLMKRDYKYTTTTTTTTTKEAATASPDVDASSGEGVVDASANLPEALFFIGLRFAPNVESINLKQHTSEFLINQINSWEGRKAGMDLMIHHVLQKDLPHDLIDNYVVTKPSAYQIPNPMPMMPAHNTHNHQEATAKANKPRSRNIPVPKNIRGQGGGDAHSVARSYSSIARSVDSSIASFDDIELESRPQSPLGNFITVEGGPPPPQKANNKKKGQNNNTEDHQSGGNATKSNINQAQLYEFLTDKIEGHGLLPCVGSADRDECCTQSIAESDQSSTRSPIQKRPRNRSRSGTEDSQQLLNM